MPSYETRTEIAAPPARVWAVTRDVESWPSWNPTTDEVTRQETGPLGPGSTALVRQPKLPRATWVVRESEPDESFVWETQGAGYRIVAAHFFEPTDAGTRMRLRLEMTGLLAPVLWLLTGRRTRRYVDLEGEHLKDHCESAP